MGKISDMLLEFHEAYDIGDDVLARKVLRRHLIEEEFKETSEVLGIDPRMIDRKKLAKELADLVYVAYGTGHVFEIDMDKAVEIVHQSNMSKLGPDGKPEYYTEGKLRGKVKKGANYIAPDMAPAIKE